MLLQRQVVLGLRVGVRVLDRVGRLSGTGSIGRIGERRLASGPLKKGAGSELTGATTARSDDREVPVALFQRAGLEGSCCH